MNTTFSSRLSQAIDDTVYWGITSALALGQLVLIGILLGFVLFVASCVLRIL